MGAVKWRHVNREMQKRGAQERNLEVWFDGVFYDQKKVQFEIHRQGFRREVDKYRRGRPIHLVQCAEYHDGLLTRYRIKISNPRGANYLFSWSTGTAD